MEIKIEIRLAKQQEVFHLKLAKQYQALRESLEKTAGRSAKEKGGKSKKAPRKRALGHDPFEKQPKVKKIKKAKEPGGPSITNQVLALLTPEGTSLKDIYTALPEVNQKSIMGTCCTLVKKGLAAKGERGAYKKVSASPASPEPKPEGA